jgi:hypothetical protein
MLKLVIAVVIFLLGLYVVVGRGLMEGFSNGRIPKRCPDVLIQKGSHFYLFNSKLAPVPGVNPVEFANLEEYVQFVEWQRSQGIRCPILFVKESYDAQGNAVYKVHPSPTDLKGGYSSNPAMNPEGTTKLYDAGRDDLPYNENSFPAYDPDNQYIGMETPLDKMFQDKSAVSPNPMDPTWGGQVYTQSLVDRGYYKGDEVYMRAAD